MGGFQTFSFGKNDEHIGNKGKRVKFEQGNIYRASFIWWPGLEDGKPDFDADAPQFVGAPIHYIAGVGYVVNQGPEYTKIAGGPAKTRIATVLVLWPCSKAGDLDKTRLMAGEAEVLPWVISGDKYKNLQQVHKEFPFGQHDITVKCDDTQFQKLTFSPCKDSLLRKLMESDKAEEIVAKMLATAQGIVPSIQDEVGREMTIEQIKDKLAGGTGAPTGGAGAASAASGASATGDIDGLVDDLLD